VGKLFVVKNKNTRKFVGEKYMAIIGASTGGILTGQGMGTKFVGIRSAIDGNIFARASHDSNGPYLAWYEVQPYDIDGDVSEQAVLVVQRPSGTTRTELQIDTNFVKSAWSKHMLGDAYPTIREVILDAADEDRNFDVNEIDEVCYSPEGETWTFVEKTHDLAELMRVPSYYFIRGDQITWLNHDVGVSKRSTLNEARIFVTAGDNPSLAYAAWSSGIKPEDAVPDTAFDYVLRENKKGKWASMPKRLIEDVSKAFKTITEALMRTDNHDILSVVFRNLINGGWENDLPWKTYSYLWNTEACRLAFSKAAKGRPVHYTTEDNFYAAADISGFHPISVPTWMYEVAKMVGYTTVKNILNVRDSGESRITVLNGDNRVLVKEALEFLNERFPWGDWGRGHVFRSLESDNFTSVHTDAGGVDTIAINFAEAETVHKVAMRIVHEITHHALSRDSMDDNWHSDGFNETLADLLLSAVTGTL